MRKNIGLTGLTALLLALVLACGISAGEAADTKCKMQFSLSGWSAFYETASGAGTITCDNGQSAKVRIGVKGGGLTAGKSSVRGDGTFTGVPDIHDLFGGYVKAGAHAGAVKSAEAQVLTKGTVSLALTAKGEGFDLGIGFGKFTITPVNRKSGK
jgi:hypothetical protein